MNFSIKRKLMVALCTVSIAYLVIVVVALRQFWTSRNSASEELNLTVLRADILKRLETVANRTVDGVLEGVRTSSLSLLAEASRSRADSQLFLSELSALARSDADHDAVAEIGRKVEELSKSTSRIVTNLALQEREMEALEGGVAKLRMDLEWKGEFSFEENANRSIELSINAANVILSLEKTFLALFAYAEVIADAFFSFKQSESEFLDQEPSAPTIAVLQSVTSAYGDLHRSGLELMEEVELRLLDASVLIKEVGRLEDLLNESLRDKAIRRAHSLIARKIASLEVEVALGGILADFRKYLISPDFSDVERIQGAQEKLSLAVRRYRENFSPGEDSEIPKSLSESENAIAESIENLFNLADTQVSLLQGIQTVQTEIQSFVRKRVPDSESETLLPERNPNFPSENYAFLTVILSSILGIGVVGRAIYVINRGVATSVAGLAEGIRAVTGGNMEVQVNARMFNEFRDIAVMLNGMIVSLFLTREFRDRFKDAALVKELESSLRKCEDRYRILEVASTVGIFRTDVVGNCHSTDSQWSAISGIPSHDAFGMDWWQAVHPSDRQRIADEWYTATSENRTYEVELRYLTADGAVNWVWVSIKAELDESGRIIGYIGSIGDINRFKEIEAGTEKARYDLKREVESLSNKIRELEDRLIHEPNVEADPQTGLRNGNVEERPILGKSDSDSLTTGAGTGGVGAVVVPSHAVPTFPVIKSQIGSIKRSCARARLTLSRCSLESSGQRALKGEIASIEKSAGYLARTFHTYRRERSLR